MALGRRSIALVGVVLIGATLTVAGIAAAEDVRRCEETTEHAGATPGSAGICVRDSEIHDPSACQAGGFYSARTGVFVYVSRPGSHVILKAGGEEDCNGERLEADAGHDGDPSNDLDVDWGQDTVGARGDLCLPIESGCSHEANPEVLWAGGEDCRITVSTDRLEQGLGCPAGSPPGSPSPGWGDLAPEIPDPIEERLPPD